VSDVLLLTPLKGPELGRVYGSLTGASRIVTVSEAAELEAQSIGSSTILIAFGTGVIVPDRILQKLGGRAYNFHAASPEYPGRDPHHFAIYDRVSRYGATLHVMTKRVDEGTILDVEWFDVPPGTTPRVLLQLANRAMLRLLRSTAPRLLQLTQPPDHAFRSWGPRKTTRRQFHEMCRLEPSVSPDEFERRFAAFDGGEYNNLVVVLHGWTFRIDKGVPRETADQLWSGFTERAYRELISAARRAGYFFSGYRDRPANRHVVWRHDVDLSMHRALRLAEIERAANVSATYFVNPHCQFYNLFEPEITVRLRRIAKLGHRIGLHFDAEAYPGTDWRRDVLADRLGSERRLIEDLLGSPIEAFSYHNPEIGGLIEIDDDEIAGLVNAYGRTFRTEYGYTSDSNGYWRFEPIEYVLRAARHERLQVLTHPGWWTPEPMPPRARVARCVYGRAANVIAHYDAFLQAHYRTNLSD